jgi:hypothetical protein
MISIIPAERYMTTCQSCNADGRKTWQIRFTTKRDPKYQQSVVIVLCQSCLWTLGINALKIVARVYSKVIKCSTKKRRTSNADET